MPRKCKKILELGRFKAGLHRGGKLILVDFHHIKL